jgi:NAD(P)-dependent dehydrogenase (short-subunit alcohol dehydrogenase family)
MTTWLITGASRGLGRELTEQALARGDRVAATLRDPAQLDDLAAAHGDRLWRRTLDVTDTAALERVVTEAFADHERIDAVISNAGQGVFGPAEDLSDEQVERLIAVNLTASIQLARRVVPHLRRQGGGVLVQISSMGGLAGAPGFAIYPATKWGIEGYFEGLGPEIAPFGIATMLVEPGVVRNTFFASAEWVTASEPYRGGPADHQPVPLEQQVVSQARVAAAVLDAAVSPQPPRRLLLGSDAYAIATGAVRARLEELEAQRESAAGADGDWPAD